MVYIYYDPLLTKVQQSSHLGYNLSHSFAPDIRSPALITKDAKVPALTYMDGTLWISGLHGNLQSILHIASSFYSFTNILINDFKARLLSSVTKPIPKKTPYATSIRYLGTWISIKKNDTTIVSHARWTINHAVYNMRNACLTDLQLLYIYNKILIPQLEYRTQMTVLMKDNCNAISSIFIHSLK